MKCTQFGGYKRANEFNLFVYPMKNLMVSTINDRHAEEVEGFHKVPL